MIPRLRGLAAVINLRGVPRGPVEPQELRSRAACPEYSTGPRLAEICKIQEQDFVSMYEKHKVLSLPELIKRFGKCMKIKPGESVTDYLERKDRLIVLKLQAEVSSEFAKRNHGPCMIPVFNTRSPVRDFIANRNQRKKPPLNDGILRDGVIYRSREFTTYARAVLQFERDLRALLEFAPKVLHSESVYRGIRKYVDLYDPYRLYEATVGRLSSYAKHKTLGPLLSYYLRCRKRFFCCQSLD